MSILNLVRVSGMVRQKIEIVWNFRPNYVTKMTNYAAELVDYAANYANFSAVFHILISFIGKNILFALLRLQGTLNLYKI